MPMTSCAFFDGDKHYRRHLIEAVGAGPRAVVAMGSHRRHHTR